MIQLYEMRDESTLSLVVEWEQVRGCRCRRKVPFSWSFPSPVVPLRTRRLARQEGVQKRQQHCLRGARERIRSERIRNRRKRSDADSPSGGPPHSSSAVFAALASFLVWVAACSASAFGDLTGLTHSSAVFAGLASFSSSVAA